MIDNTNTRERRWAIASWLAVGAAVMAILLLGFVSALAAQSPADSAAQRAVKVYTDSIRLESCRGGTVTGALTCSGALYAPRVTYLRRFAWKIDSIMSGLTKVQPPPGVDSVSVSFDYLTSTIWTTGAVGAFHADSTAAVCASVEHPAGKLYTGYPAVTARLNPDASISFVARPDSIGTGLLGLCGEHPLWKVAWSLTLLGLERPIAVPVAVAIHP